MGVTDGADIHAEQLELGRHVGTEERRALRRPVARQRSGPCCSPGRPAEHAAVPAGAFADGEDRRVRGTAITVDHDAAACRQSGPQSRARGVLRANAGGEHDQVGFKKFAVWKTMR